MDFCQEKCKVISPLGKKKLPDLDERTMNPEELLALIKHDF